MTKMNAKNVMVSLLTIVSVLFLATSVSASDSYHVFVLDGHHSVEQATLTAGETVELEVWYTANFAEDFDRDVTIEVELDAGKEEVKAVSGSMVIESGKQDSFIFTLKIPHEFADDEVNHDATLTVEIDGENHKYTKEFNVNIQKPQYSAEVKSVTTSQSVDAGEVFPVDIVLKNIGYLDLNDVYVTAKISALNIESTVYFEDLVSIEDDDDEDDEDSASGRIMLEVPYGAEAGVYALEVEVTNDDTTTTVVKQIVVKNDFANTVIVSSHEKTVATGEDAVYELLIVNPTNNVKVYRLVSVDGSDVSTSGDAIIAVPAGSSKAVKITASAETEGEYNFDVSVFSGEELVETVSLTLEAEGSSNASLTVVLTIILAIIFIVLLVVLIVLIGKKPAKAEEFGESYY
jgi:hypothetical protein